MPHPLYFLVPLTVTCLAAACGSTSVTDITGPDDVRCAASITAEPSTVPAAGGTITVSVVSERDCTWSAGSDAAWLQVRSASGQGSGSFAATAARNDLPSPRTGSIVLNEQRITVTQDGRACTFTLQGPAGPLPASGGPGSVQVSTIAGCGWTVTSSAPWLVPRTSAGSGSGVIPFDVQPNTGPEREASVTIAGRTVVVVQAAPAAACSFAIAPPAQDFSVAGGDASVNVTTAPGCQWTVTGGSPWITVLTPAGSGSGQAHYSVSANTATAARQATLTIAGRVHTVTQPGVTCTFTLAPPERTIPAAGGAGTVQVSTLPACGWTATSNAGWVLLTNPAGSGDGQLAYQVLANTLPEARTARITVGGQTHTVIQDAAAAACTYQLEPASRAVDAAGGPATVRVNTQPGCAWTAASAVDWVTVSPQSLAGSGPADIGYSVAPNGDVAERAGSITIAGQSHAITQAGAAPACTYSLEPPSSDFAAEGGTATVRVNTQPGCAWTAASTVPWAAVVPASASGTGTADITYTVSANTSIDPRAGTLVIADQSHAITQAGSVAVACVYTLSPAERLFDETGGVGTVQVTTGATCGWTASADESWVAVLDDNGLGVSEISYMVSPGPRTVDRTANVLVNGAHHSVIQRGSGPPGRGGTPN